LVLRPQSTVEVSEIVKYCSDHGLAVVPQGGNTGLVGGSVPVFDEVVVSMQLMNRVISFDKIAGMQSEIVIDDTSSYISEFSQAHSSSTDCVFFECTGYRKTVSNKLCQPTGIN